MQPVLLEAAGDGERPALRWRGFSDRSVMTNAWGVMWFVGPPEWGLHLYLGRWLIGIERTREED